MLFYFISGCISTAVGIAVFHILEQHDKRKMTGQGSALARYEAAEYELAYINELATLAATQQQESDFSLPAGSKFTPQHTHCPQCCCDLSKEPVETKPYKGFAGMKPFIPQPTPERSKPQKSRVPASYQRAELRNVTPYCATSDQIGFGLNLPDGQVMRYTITKFDATRLAEWLTDYLIRDQSLNSSGNPSVEVSTPQDGVNVCPPTKSSSAINAEG